MIVEMKIPSPGESITEVEVGTWLKQDGDAVQLDEPLCEVETEKATLTLNAEASGALKILIAEGTAASVGDVVCSINTDASGTVSSPKAEEAVESPAKAKSSSPAQQEVSAPPKPAGSVPSHATGHPSVAAKKMMDEQEVPAGDVQGTGKEGRITKGDVLEHLKQPSVSTPAPEKSAEPVSGKIPASTPAPVATKSGGQRRERMSVFRRKIAERLLAAKHETAMLTTFNEVDMSEIYRLRTAYKEKFLQKHGVKLGMMGFFTKAVTNALLAFPTVNAMIDGNEIVFHDYVDIGIAVSAPKGLVVPVVRNTESMSVAEIEAEILRLAKKARDNQLTIAEMSGGTFSITNGGVFGSMLSTPILNPPQSAILGMHNILDRPVAIKGQVEIRPIMYVALSYDHRVIDGRESVSFLYRIKEYLEDPARLFLEV